MLIDGYEYKFLYSVGAFLAFESAKFPKKPSSGEQARIVVSMAAIMSKEYEDAKKLEDPEYRVNYLTVEKIRHMPFKQLEQLSVEVNDAVIAGSLREVEAEPLKKTKRSVK